MEIPAGAPTVTIQIFAGGGKIGTQQYKADSKEIFISPFERNNASYLVIRDGQRDTLYDFRADVTSTQIECGSCGFRKQYVEELKFENMNYHINGSQRMDEVLVLKY